MLTNIANKKISDEYRYTSTVLKGSQEQKTMSDVLHTSSRVVVAEVVAENTPANYSPPRSGGRGNY